MSDGKVVIDTELDESGAKKGFNKLEQSAKSTGKAMAKGVGLVAGAIGTVSGMATKAYSSYEQLKGGVETLFKDSAGKLMDYADVAYKTAGLSANKYMETATGFSASLLQSLNGDTQKATEYANRAIIDMSDNANKMGTAIGSIQYAYQGFAKQNYTIKLMSVV